MNHIHDEHCLIPCPRVGGIRLFDEVWEPPKADPLMAAHAEIGRLQAELAEANKQVVDVNDEDNITFDGYQIRIHEHDLAGHVKARIRFQAHHLIKMLIMELLSQSMELDPDKPQEWRGLDMAWVL